MEGDLMISEVEYEGYRIRASSFEVLTEGGEPRGWMPRVNLISEVTGGQHSEPITFYVEAPFPTREQADRHAIEAARRLIDERKGRKGQLGRQGE